VDNISTKNVLISLLMMDKNMEIENNKKRKFEKLQHGHILRFPFL